ncbi:seven-hairpin glycosidase [Hysterangium stoloniferum]|nr:seven-hairpin glycosidase [Hysterangium stoloniferum]
MNKGTAGTPSPDTDTSASDAPASEWKIRAESVKEAFLHTYNGYETYAPFPSDELQPLGNKGIQNFNGWGVTMVDALDTMLLMDLTDQYTRAVAHVASIDFSMPPGIFGSFFETVIRYLGGLLSAYALSNEPIMLARAIELGEKLLPAFGTPSGLPASGVNPKTGDISGFSNVLLAEMASCQMEYKYLAHITGRKEFFTAADKVMDVMANTQDPNVYMWPTTFSTTNGRSIGSTFTVGSLADSAYEYLLKQYLMSNKTETHLAELYVSSMNGILSNLVYLSPTRNLLYVTDSYYSMPIYPTRNFEHLSCFFPGLLALGVSTLPESLLPPAMRQLHMWAAEGIAHTCWIMYADAESGLGAEAVTFDNGWAGKPEKWVESVEKWEKAGKKGGKPPGVMGPEEGKPMKGSKGKDYAINKNTYLLRPETLESMYIMYRTTGESKWRNRGWRIWEAIVAKTKTDSGFATVVSVDTEDPVRQESLPSYFLAETVKYAYLLAIDSDPFPVSEFVFNTEAHPFPIFQWRDWEREKWGMK